MKILEDFEEVTYSSDYRSPPSGCGTIERRDGSLVLIQYNGCNESVEDGVYEKVEYLDCKFSEDYEESMKLLMDKLREYGVERVYDYDLMMEYGVGDDLDGYMSLEKFEELRMI